MKTFSVSEKSSGREKEIPYSSHANSCCAFTLKAVRKKNKKIVKNLPGVIDFNFLSE